MLNSHDVPVSLSKLTLTGSPVYDRYIRAANAEDISPVSLFQFFESCKAKYSKSTLNVVKAALRKSVNISLIGKSDYRVKAGFDSAFDAMKVGKRTQAIEPNVLMSEEEVSALTSAATPRIAAVIRLLSVTGIRVSELTGIRIRDCTRNGSIIAIRIHGKGDDNRIVFLPVSTFEEICAIFQGREYLFETVRGGAMSRVYVWREISKLGKSILKRRITPHCFRHSFATNQLIAKGRSLKAVSTYLGHRSTATTLRFYIHDELTPETLFPEAI